MDRLTDSTPDTLFRLGSYGWLVTAEPTESKSFAGGGLVLGTWWVWIGNPTPSPWQHTVNASTNSEEPGSVAECFTFCGGSSHFSGKMGLLSFPTDQAAGSLLLCLCLAKVIHAIVTSRIYNYNSLYAELPLNLTQNLQLVQTAVAYFLTWTPLWWHMQPVLC